MKIIFYILSVVCSAATIGLAAPAFAEVQTSLSVTLPDLVNGEADVFSASQASGPTASNSGNISQTYSGLVKFVQSSGTGRFATFNGVTRYGVPVDSFQIFQSFLTPDYFTVVSANTSCPGSSATYNWIYARMRSPDATRFPSNASSSSLYVGGVFSYNPASSQFTGSSYFDLAGPTLNSIPTYSLSGFNSATCSSGSYLVQAGGSSSFDSFGTVFFGSTTAVFVGAGGNPQVAMMVPQQSLSGASMAALSDYRFTGLYTEFSSRSTQERQNVYLVPDGSGTTWTIRTADNLDDPSTYTNYGTIDCTSLNSPTTGFCSGTISRQGLTGTGNIVCSIYTSGAQNLMACSGQRPADNTIGVSILAYTPKKSVLSVSVPTSVGVATPGNSNSITATLTNLSGRAIPTMGNPSSGALQLAAPWSNTGAFGGGNGTCGTSLNAYASCTLDITFTSGGYGTQMATYRVAYDNGVSTTNATALLVGATGLSSIDVSPVPTLDISGSRQYTATASYSDLSTQDVTSAVVWSTNNTALATISSAGVGTGVGSGTVTVSAAIGGTSGSTSSVVNTAWAGTKLEGSSTSSGYSNASVPSNAVATDSSGNLYLVGNLYHPFEGNALIGASDAMVMKLNSSGVKQWISLVGAEGGYLSAVAAAVDGGDNIYLLGGTDVALGGNSLTGDTDFFLTKLNGSGTQVWTKQLGATGAYTYPTAVAVDGGNNIYVAGYTEGNLDGNTLVGSTDAFVTKYNSSGTKQWTKTLGEAGLTLYLTGVAVDGGNNVYLTGTVDGGLDGNSLAGYQDFFLVKYDSTGTKQWTRQLGEEYASIYVGGVAVDGGNNVYVSGSTDAGLDGNSLVGWNDAFLVKYNSSGTKQWTQELGASAALVSVAQVTTDGSNNIFIGGNTDSGLDGNSQTGTQDFFITKYNSSGTIQWTRQLGPSATSVIAKALRTDASGNAVITGVVHRGGLDGNSRVGNYDLFATKYNGSGTKQWTIQMGSPARYTYGRSVAIDRSDNVYLAGSTNGDIGGNTRAGEVDALLVKYDSSGARQWVKQLGVSTKSAQAYGVATDAGNNIYIAGDTSGGVGGNSLIGSQDGFLSKYDSSGSIQWTKQFGISGKSISVNAISVDAGNNAVVVGSANGGLDGNTLTGNNDFFVTKYNSSGTWQWTRQLGKASVSTIAKAVAVDGDNNIYVTGYTYGGLDGNTQTGTGSDFFVTKYDSSGTKQWTRQLGSATSAKAHGIAVDSGNSVYLMGETESGLDGNAMVGGRDAFITKYNSSGTKQWTVELGVSGSMTIGYAALVDGSDNIYISGRTEGALDGQSVSPLGSAFITKYNSAGTKQWTRTHGATTRSSSGLGIARNSANSIFIAGSTNGPIDGTALSGSNDSFVGKYSSAGVKQ